jgi:hypothetical protein
MMGLSGLDETPLREDNREDTFKSSFVCETDFSLYESTEPNFSLGIGNATEKDKNTSCFNISFPLKKTLTNRVRYGIMCKLFPIFKILEWK